MVMWFPIVGRVFLLVGSVLTFVGVSMIFWITLVSMEVSRSINMFMRVRMGVVVRMNDISMLVFVGMGMRMRMHMGMLMLRKSFHLPLQGESSADQVI